MSHINGGLLCESSGLFGFLSCFVLGFFVFCIFFKATEIRYRTPGAHRDTGFDPKKGLWSFPFWLLIHRQLTTC